MATPMTYDLAMAAGKDAANRQMRQAGRSVWSAVDYDLSVDTFDRLFPEASRWPSWVCATCMAIVPSGTAHRCPTVTAR